MAVVREVIAILRREGNVVPNGKKIEYKIPDSD
jgi:hypothetical protein